MTPEEKEDIFQFIMSYYNWFIEAEHLGFTLTIEKGCLRVQSPDNTEITLLNNFDELKEFIYALAHWN